MDDRTLTEDRKNVGGQLFEELFFEFIEKKYDISKKDFTDILAEKQHISNSIPVSILRLPKLSSLESIVKFLRENREMSYTMIGEHLERNPRTLAVTYAVAHQKMPERFDISIDNDVKRIPFTAFSRRLGVLECICIYLKSQDNSYAEIARMIHKDQRTVWTVCKRAERKLEIEHVEKRDSVGKDLKGKINGR